MVDNNNSNFSFEFTLNPTLLAFILGTGTVTVTVLGIQHIVINNNNQQLNSEQAQTQIVDCPSPEKPNISKNPFLTTLP